MEKPTAVPADLLELIAENMIDVFDFNQTNKLSEILDSYANKTSSDVYTIQNPQKRQARGVILDLDYFFELIFIKRLAEQAENFQVDTAALDSFKQKATSKLDEAAEQLSQNDDDFADIMKIAEIEL
ncbi:hypothetical protein [Paenibacillus agricola]|uniref:Uncharacterized protein n=1 Tax=Paenibacillus agricola TaxID=2716264 RepID=A0ABX0J9C3_9BACL|nr:hypothetical protein [Paenibacillus agricola]NHN33052.1 hypothetical protein [Paenibacillus agricola]